jgi:hypothetical protein
MPRRKPEPKSTAEARTLPIFDSENVAIARIPIHEATKFFDIGQTHPAWEEHLTPTDLGKIPGAFVRVVPPAYVTDEVLERIVAQVKEFLPRALRIHPRTKSAVLTKMEPMPNKTTREIVTEIIDAANTGDRDALRARCEEIMGEVGL